MESQTFIVPKKNGAPVSPGKMLSELEQIVACLESGSLPLGGTLNESGHGVQLACRGRAKLQWTEQHVQILLSNSEDVSLTSFTPDNE